MFGGTRSLVLAVAVYIASAGALEVYFSAPNLKKADLSRTSDIIQRVLSDRVPKVVVFASDGPVEFTR